MDGLQQDDSGDHEDSEGSTVIRHHNIRGVQVDLASNNNKGWFQENTYGDNMNDSLGFQTALEGKDTTGKQNYLQALVSSGPMREQRREIEFNISPEPNLGSSDDEYLPIDQ